MTFLRKAGNTNQPSFCKNERIKTSSCGSDRTREKEDCGVFYYKQHKDLSHAKTDDYFNTKWQNTARRTVGDILHSFKPSSANLSTSKAQKTGKHSDLETILDLNEVVLVDDEIDVIDLTEAVEVFGGRPYAI